MSRTALVTGANKGIGRAIVDRLVKDGVRVAGLYRSPGIETDDLVRTLGQAVAPGLALRCDLTEETQIAAALTRVADEFSGLDILVNNAGTADFAFLADLDRQRWDHTVAVNLTAPYLLTRGALPLLRDNASIVSISSGLGVVGAPGKSDYAATKAALIGFTKALSREVGRRGVRVNAIAPGIIDTGMAAAGLSPVLRERYETQCALGRIGQPGEIAEVVAFLADSRSSYISGQVLMVDGGM